MGEMNVQEISARLRDLRNKKELTQEQLADAIGISTQTMRNYEAMGEGKGGADKEKAIPGMRLETLFNLAEYFGVSVDYLLCRHDIPNPEMEKQAICDYTGLSPKALQSLKSINGHELLNILLEDYRFHWVIQGISYIKQHEYGAPPPLLDMEKQRVVFEARQKLPEYGYHVVPSAAASRAQMLTSLNLIQSIFEKYLFPDDATLQAYFRKASIYNPDPDDPDEVWDVWDYTSNQDEE